MVAMGGGFQPWRDGVTPLAHSSPYPPPGPVPASSRSKALWWTVASIVITSALWAVALFGFGASASGSTDAYLGSEPDLRGYHVGDDLCGTVDFTAVESKSFKIDRGEIIGPRAVTQHHSAVDSARCVQHFYSANGMGSGSMSLITVVEAHKQTNPIPNYRARFETAGQPDLAGRSAQVERVSGIGDSAYITYVEDRSLRAMTLTARVGWFIYQVSWNVSLSEASKSSDISKDEKQQALVRVANATLPKLRN